MFSPLAPRSFKDTIDTCRELARSRGIALIIPGDLHLWGVTGGNRSDLFATLLGAFPFGKVVLLGDLFDSDRQVRETAADRRVLSMLSALDREDRVHVVRGNHDRALLSTVAEPNEGRGRRAAQRRARDAALAWLARPRMHADIVYACADQAVFVGAAHPGGQGVADAIRPHPGSSDVLVLAVGNRTILFEHGDAYDRWVQRGRPRSVLTRVGGNAYDLSVAVERRNLRLADMSASVKRRVSMWRGVCRSVVEGAYARSVALPFPVHGTVCGHTHYPGFVMHEGIPHVNVGSFRGHRPSFAVVTGDGELMPPFVIEHQSAPARRMRRAAEHGIVGS